MKKLFKYLDKIGADYKPEKIGYNYFYNVVPVLRDMAIVSFDYSDNPTQVMKAMQQRKMIEKYCSRYGYIIFYRGGFPGCCWLWIAQKDDLEKVNYMGSFVKRSVSACEKLNHLYHIGKTTISSGADLNNKMKLIMDRYGREYKRMTFLVYGGAAV